MATYSNILAFFVKDKLSICVCVPVQLSLTLCNPMDCSSLGSSVHGIFQARVLEWGAIVVNFSFSALVVGA